MLSNQHEGNRKPSFWDTEGSLAKNKSNSPPPRNKNITLENYVDFLSKLLLEELQVNVTRRFNAMKEEQMH